MLRLHYLEHVPFEGLGSIGDWARHNGVSVSVTRFHRNDPLPKQDGFDWLAVMGGPMGVADEDRLPWLRQEKRFIQEAIAAEKVVIGICLGAQLIAEVLGSRVYRNPFREIGWFPIRFSGEAVKTGLLADFPETITAFHWHGDTFDLPPGTVRLASSEACLNQAFSKGSRVFGFQFHLEATRESASALIENCGDEMVEEDYIQTAEEILAAGDRFKTINRYMDILLDRLRAGAVK
jgi:GMP synthase-like glutamine amidotransferase